MDNADNNLAERIKYSNTEMITILDRKHLTCLEANQSFLNKIGCSREEIIGQSIYELGIIADEDSLVFKDNLKSIGEFTPIPFRSRTENEKTIDLLVSPFPINYNLQDCWLCFIHDQSSQHQFENELVRLDRLNLLGEMAAAVGHEVRNPMTTVRGFLQMLQMRDTDSVNNSYYNLMIEELDRANYIISEFLGIARNQDTDLQLGSINQILNALYPLIEAQALMKNARLIFDYEECSCVYLNEKEIRQMVINLTCNGLEAMESPGNLRIGTQQTETEVILFVSDQGTGIPAEFLEKISAPFFTTKERGTGLGLPVCYNIAARHNARIEISTSPHGTTFCVHFPIPNQSF